MGILKTQFLRIDSTSGLVYGNNGIGSEFIIDSLFKIMNMVEQVDILSSFAILVLTTLARELFYYAS